MEQSCFNLYELARWIYIEKYFDVFDPNKKIISKEELDTKFYLIPQKDNDKSVPIVVLNEEIERAKREINVKTIRYMLFESIKDKAYIIIPENDLRGAETLVLTAENMSKSTNLISEEIDVKRKIRSEQKTALTFEVFKKRFERYIKAVLDSIFGMSDALYLFKENENYRFTGLDREFFSILYDTYEKQGKYLIRQEYEKIDPSYIEFLLCSIEKMVEQHEFNISLEPIKEKLNVILLKTQKKQLKDDLLKLETLIQQVANVAENDCIEEKINFMQLNHEHIMNCYQTIFNEIRKYLS